MKKKLVTILIFLLLLCLASCKKNNKYEIVVFDDYDVMVNYGKLNNKCFKSGTEISIELAAFSTSLGVMIDGEIALIDDEILSTNTYKFKMPDHKCVIKTIKFGVVSHEKLELKDIPITPNGFRKEDVIGIEIQPNLIDSTVLDKVVDDFDEILECIDTTYTEIEEDANPIYYDISDNFLRLLPSENIRIRYIITLKTGEVMNVDVVERILFISFINENSESKNYMSEIDVYPI